MPETPCPKCGYGNASDAKECLACGIIFSKYKAKVNRENKIKAEEKAERESAEAAYPELKRLKKVKVVQEESLKEAVINHEYANRYKILDDKGKMIFDAREQSVSSFADKAKYNIGGDHLISTDVNLMDGKGRYGIRLSIEGKLLSKKMIVHDIGHRIIGTAETKLSLLKPVIQIKNRMGEEAFNLKGGGLGKFAVCVGDSEKGSINKVWAGLLKEAFTDADEYEVTFPAKANPVDKAVLIAAAIMIDYLYYETRKEKKYNSWFK